MRSTLFYCGSPSIAASIQFWRRRTYKSHLCCSKHSALYWKWGGEHGDSCLTRSPATCNFHQSKRNKVFSLHLKAFFFTFNTLTENSHPDVQSSGVSWEECLLIPMKEGRTKEVTPERGVIPQKRGQWQRRSQAEPKKERTSEKGWEKGLGRGQDPIPPLATVLGPIPGSAGITWVTTSKLCHPHLLICIKNQ